MKIKNHDSHSKNLNSHNKRESQLEDSQSNSLVKEGLLRFGKLISSTQELNELLQSIVDIFIEIFNSDFVVICVNKIPITQIFFSGKLLKPQSENDLQKFFKQSNTDSIMEKQIGINCSNAIPQKHINIFRDIIPDERIITCISIPLLINDEFAGLIFLCYRKDHKFSGQEQFDMELLATQTAFAIKYARLYEEQKKQKTLVGSRTALAFMGMANSIWGHTIKGSVINIRNIATLLRKDVIRSDISPDNSVKILQRLDLLESQADKVINLNLTPTLTNENAQPLYLKRLIKERIDQLCTTEKYKDVNFFLVCKEDYCVKIEPAWFRSVIDTLLQNGITAMQGQKKKKFVIEIKQNQEDVEIFISDTGKGIPPEIQSSILKNQIRNSEGMGLGLLMTQAILQSCNGDIKLISTNHSGTTFKIVLPSASCE